MSIVKLDPLQNVKEVIFSPVYESVGAGCEHSIVRLRNGNTYSWGSCRYYQLGHGDLYWRHTPKLMSRTYEKVDCGYYFSMGVTPSTNNYPNDLETFGRNNRCQLGVGYDIVIKWPRWIVENTRAMSAGQYHGLAVDSSGRLYTWGYDYWGQCGRGPNFHRISKTCSPFQVSGTWKVGDMNTVAGGGSHSLAIDQNDDLYSTGHNTYGQLGHGDTQERSVFTPIPGKWKFVDAGRDFSIALTATGNQLYAWGSNGSGQLGLGGGGNQVYPQLVPGFSDWKMLSAEGSFCLGIRENGDLYAWGNNHEGQLGLGHTNNQSSPQQVPGKWRCVAAGTEHSIGIDENGDVYGWGANHNYHLGLGDRNDRLVPTLITFPPD